MNERELRALAAYVDFPAERDLAPAVRARLRGRPGRRRALVVAFAALLLALAVALAVPPARSAILRFFHLRGVRIELVDELPAVRPASPLDLGRPIPLGEADEIAGFRPLTSSLLGAPDRVTWDGRMVWFAYGHVRLLLSQFRGSERIEYLKKALAEGTRLQTVTVGGEPGYFLSGARHFLYVTPTSLIRDERVRLARDVLLWEHGELTLRLEADLTLAQALEIARSLR